MFHLYDVLIRKSMCILCSVFLVNSGASEIILLIKTLHVLTKYRYID